MYVRVYVLASHGGQHSTCGSSVVSTAPRLQLSLRQCASSASSHHTHCKAHIMYEGKIMFMCWYTRDVNMCAHVHSIPTQCQH